MVLYRKKHEKWFYKTLYNIKNAVDWNMGLHGLVGVHGAARSSRSTPEDGTLQGHHCQHLKAPALCKRYDYSVGT